jgi:RNase P subunit RPR2
MFGCVLTILLILNSIGIVYAQSPYLEPGHLGVFCTPCHQKYSYRQPYAGNLTASVKNPSVIDMFPCYKEPCHYSSPVKWGRGGNRYSLHMQKEICKNCHAGINGEYDVHTVHQRIKGISVNCKICHQSFRGWNSSLVIIPAPRKEQIFVYEGIEIAIPNKECEYCHRNIIGKTRLHEVHEPVLKIACQDCHGQIIESRPDLIAKITGEPLPEKKVKLEALPVRELSMFFDEIARQFLNFYESLRK